MNRPNLLHSVFLIVSIIACFLWANTPTLAAYNLQLTGGLTLLYFAFRMILVNRQPGSASSLFSTIILVDLTLLLVFSTGSATSPLFFILDFLLFALVLLFEPFQAGVVAVFLIGIFLYQNINSLNSEILINLITLAFITPLAIIFGRNFISSLAQKGRIKILSDALLANEADSLLWVSTSAKPSLSSVLNSVSDLVIYFNSKGDTLTGVPSGFIEKLRMIQKDLISLYTSTSAFEKSIKETSDRIEEEQ